MLSTIFDYLPSEIRNDKFIKELLKGFLTKISANQELCSLGRTLVSSTMLARISYDHPGYEDILEPTTNENNLLYVNLASDTLGLFLRVKRNNGYELNAIILEGPESKTIEWQKKAGVVRLFIEEKTEYNHVITNYETSLRYYNSSYHEFDVDVDNELNTEFAILFGIDPTTAGFYRQNFEENHLYLNECKNKAECAFTDQIAKEMGLSFSRPFRLENFEEFIVEEINKPIEDIPEEYEPDPIDFEETGKLKEVEEVLRSAIGDYDELVISQNFLDNISFFYLGLIKVAFSSATLIKKLNGEFIEYDFYLDQNTITYNTRVLSKEDLKAYYDGNEDNYKVDGLCEFFGLDFDR